MKFAHGYCIIPSFDTIFKCISKQSSNVLDLQNATCTCNQWQLFGIPCVHVISIVLFMQ